MDIHAARSHLTHRPPVMDGESVPGYIFRAAHISGHKRMKDLAAALVDRQVIQPPWTYPSNLNALCENLRPVFDSAQQIVEEHTCLPAHLPFVHPAALKAVTAHIYDGVKNVGLAGALGLTGRAVISKPEMALCTACVREQTFQWGFCWWLREHSLAGIGYCPHHGQPLVAGCRRCRFSQSGSRLPRLPEMKCWCGNPHKTSHPSVGDEDGAVLTRIACLGVRLLEGALSGRGSEEVGMYYHWKAQQAGYAAGTRIKSVDLVQRVLERYSTSVLRRLNAVLETDRNWLQACLGKRGAPNMLGRNLLLFDFFGGQVPTAADFEEASEHCGKLARQSAKRGPTASNALTSEIEEDRRAILAFLEANPHASRTQVLKKLGRIVVRTRERDAQWYDALLSSRRSESRRPNTQAQTEAYWRDLDDRTCENVLRRKNELLSTAGGYPKPMTKTALLKGAARGNEMSKKLLERMPKTLEALERFVETTHEYKLRYAQTILEQPRTDGEAVMEAKKRTGLLPVSKTPC